MQFGGYYQLLLKVESAAFPLDTTAWGTGIFEIKKNKDICCKMVMLQTPHFSFCWSANPMAVEKGNKVYK